MAEKSLSIIEALDKAPSVQGSDGFVERHLPDSAKAPIKPYGITIEQALNNQLNDQRKNLNEQRGLMHNLRKS